MKNNMILSVIIPVYNVEKYLDRCLQSISNQPSKQIEIILVNDGSTDRSKEICEEWTRKDERMILFSKYNEGVSVARNVGMQLASGKYYYFVDSDDWIEEDHIANILNCLQGETDFDILLTGLSVDKVTAKRIHPKKLSNENKMIKNDDSLGLLILDHQTVGGFISNKVFSAEMIHRHNLQFKKGMSMMEDLNFVLGYLTFMTKPALYVPLHGYHYEIREESVTFTQRDEKRKEEYVIVINSLLKTLNSIPDRYKETKDMLFHYIVGESARFAMYLSTTDEYYDKKYLSSIAKSNLFNFITSKQSITRKSKTVCYTAATFLFDLRAQYQTAYIKGDKNV